MRRYPAVWWHHGAPSVLAAFGASVNSSVRGVEGEGGELGATTLARLRAYVERNNESEFFRTTLGVSLYTLKNFNTPTFRFLWKKYLVSERHAVVCCFARHAAC